MPFRCLYYSRTTPKHPALYRGRSIWAPFLGTFKNGCFLTPFWIDFWWIYSSQGALPGAACKNDTNSQWNFGGDPVITQIPNSFCYFYTLAWASGRVSYWGCSRTSADFYMFCRTREICNFYTNYRWNFGGQKMNWIERKWVELNCELSWKKMSWIEVWISIWIELNWIELFELNLIELNSMSWFELNWIELFDTELNWKCVELLNWFELPSLHCGQGGSRCFQFRSSHIVLQRNASFTNPTVSQSVVQLYYCVMAEIERVVLIDSFVCVLTSWSCTTFFDFIY